MPHQTIYWREGRNPEAPFDLVFHHVANREVMVHDHDFAELFWMESGVCHHIINGAEQVLHPNDFLLIMPEDRHGFNCWRRKDFRLVNLSFPAASLHRLLTQYQLCQTSFWGGKNQPRLRHLSPEASVWIAGAFRELNNGPRTQLAFDHFMLSLFLKLKDPTTDPFQNCPVWLQPACHEMRTSAAFQQGPRFLEQRTGRSWEHIGRILRSITGKTPAEWITEFRLEYAAEQMTYSNRSILEIALDCGFNSLSHFCFVFKRQWGLPPLQYRKARASRAFPVSGLSKHDMQVQKC
jgi:AraC family transcriptional regulator, dual regulator of chb operon